MNGTINPEVRARLEQAIQQNTIMLFTKGNKTFPRCGWSKSVIEIFAGMNVPFETLDILEDPDIRPALTAISDWPTTPQIFLKGEFVGGGDVVRELHARGELEPLVRAALAKSAS